MEMCRKCTRTILVLYYWQTINILNTCCYIWTLKCFFLFHRYTRIVYVAAHYYTKISYITGSHSVKKVILFIFYSKIFSLLGRKNLSALLHTLVLKFLSTCADTHITYIKNLFYKSKVSYGVVSVGRILMFSSY